MIVVLEGPDGVGKTTLADALESAWSGKSMRFRSGPPPEDTLAAMHYQDDIDEIAKANQPNTLVLVDRFHVGELVYGPLLRGESGITFGEAAAIDKMLEGNNAALVHCHLDRHEMTRRLIARDGGIPDEKSGAKLEHSYALRAAFQHKIGRPDAFGILPGSWMIADMSWYPDQLAEQILTSARMTGKMLRPHNNWVGPIDATMLFAMPSDECLSVEHLAWCLENIHKVSPLIARRSGFIFPSTDLQPTKALLTRHVVALGDADQWLMEVGGIVPDVHIAHGPDRHEWDDDGEDWRYSVRYATGLEQSRTDDTGTIEASGVKYA